MYFINVILPIPLQKLFTYKITKAEADFLQIGIRVAVPFGKSKIFTALVLEIHNTEPTAYQAKEIHQILDEKPIITQQQLEHWQWISDYYMCSLGDVLRAGIPSLFLLESETLVIKNEEFENEAILNDDEYIVYEALQKESILKIKELSKILNKKNVLPLVQNLIKKDVVSVKEEIFQQYKPKLLKYIRLNNKYSGDKILHQLLDELKNAHQQRAVLLKYFHLQSSKNKQIKVKTLQKQSNVSPGVIKALVDKNIFEIYTIQTDRVSFDIDTIPIKELNEYQQEACKKIKKSFEKHNVTLLHGITSSGKTEIYSKLIDEVLQSGKQVLYLLPEIALTTQIISRLQKYFGDKISVFHSKYTLNERVEVWNNLLSNQKKTQIILGARSAVLLPFSNLGLIIVDEEHETSFKQFDPAPRYHARDAAIVLGNLHNTKVLLGSATPSIESYFNAKNRKYGLVELNRRYGDVLLPEIELTDIKEKHRKKLMTAHFSDRLITLIQEALAEKEQIILFQNRRGFSPVVECTTCGIAPQCPNCDVSLTYHKFKEELRCHYCGYSKPMPKTCPACENPTLSTKGFGTEQIEIELKEIFPQAKVGRMDLDTTRGKYGYHKIISAFQDHEIDILVGTQMLSKGLDFNNVTLVGILNADNMLNFPDFRAHERSYQLMAQVSGRAGRANKRGKVIIQTFNPFHQILQQVSTNDYDNMYKDQINERYEYHYPPIVRLVKITLKHKDFNKVNIASEWLGKSFKNVFYDNVLGPASPSISRIRNLYLKNILIKLPNDRPIIQSKKIIQKIKNSFQSIPEFRSVRFIIDVDNY
ncbi:MAG: primosomal protein N' [Bacteroidota bacterium]